MAHDVFISYSSKDQKIVEGLSAYLEQQGIRCFVAYRDIPKGKVWAAEITKAIENCKCMVVVFSENFNSSDQVDREIELCFEEGKTIIPLKTQDSKLSGAKKYYLKNINWIDAFPEPEKYFGELFTAIDRLLSPAGKTVPTKMESNTVDISQSIASSSQHILKIRPNLSCQVFVDGEMKTTIEADKITKIPLNKGSYYLEFVSIKDNSDNYSCDYRISDVEELLTVDLKSIEKERIRLESLELSYFYDYSSENMKYGFRDKHTDEVIIPPIYDSVPWSFSEGLADVKLNDRCGYINKAGKEVIPLIYDSAHSFSEALAAVKLNDKWGFIDKAGKKVIPLIYDDAGSFSGGLVAVMLNGKWGFIDKAGKEVIPLIYDDARCFSEGLARVKLNGRYGLINKTGEIISSLYDEMYYEFDQDLWRVKLNGRYGLINKTGEIIISTLYDEMDTVLRENLWRVKLNGKYGFINKFGVVVIPLEYDYAYNEFPHGLSDVKLNNKYGYIDQNGKEVIPLKYDYAGTFIEGLAIVKLNGETFRINKQGNRVGENL